jgi:hypothetical protein
MAFVSPCVSMLQLSLSTLQPGNDSVLHVPSTDPTHPNLKHAACHIRRPSWQLKLGVNFSPCLAMLRVFQPDVQKLSPTATTVCVP